MPTSVPGRGRPRGTGSHDETKSRVAGRGGSRVRPGSLWRWRRGERGFVLQPREEGHQVVQSVEQDLGASASSRRSRARRRARSRATSRRSPTTSTACRRVDAQGAFVGGDREADDGREEHHGLRQGQVQHRPDLYVLTGSTALPSIGVMKRSAGSIALLGGGEWTEPCRALDSHLLAPRGVRRGVDRADRGRVRAPRSGRRAGRRRGSADSARRPPGSPS